MVYECPKKVGAGECLPSDVLGAVNTVGLGVVKNDAFGEVG